MRRPCHGDIQIFQEKMTVLFVQRVGNTLVADGDESIAAFAKIPFGKPLRCEVKQPRNIGFHRLYFSMCQRIGNGVGLDAENISDLFKLATGHVTIIKTKGGTVRLPKSIAFANLDNIAFREFVERCIQCAYDEWGIDPASLADLLAPQESQARK